MSTTPGRILVVGASGQLGAALVEQIGAAALPAGRRQPEIAGRQPEVAGSQPRPPGRQLDPAWLHLDLDSIAAHPTQLDGLIERHNIAAVFCAAGATDVERCESDHAWAAAANHTGPLALARAASNVPFVFYSTDYVFDGREAPGQTAGPYAEDDPVHPLSVYGRSKADGEQAILAVHPRALVLRTTTVYGPDPQGKNFLYTLRRLLSSGKPMRVPTDQLATPTYNADLAAASIALVERGATGIFHVAGPDFLSRYDFALRACDLLHLDPAPMARVTTPELAQKAARPLLGGLRIDKLTALLGAGCMRGIDQGIADWAAATATTVSA